MTDRIYSTSLPERDCPTSPTFVSGTYPSSSPPLSSSGTDLLSRRQMSEDESNEFQIDSTGMDSRSVSTTASDQRDYLDGGDLLRASATVNDGETLNHPLQKSRNSLGFDGNDGRTAATTPSPSTTTLSGTLNTFSSLEENSTAQTSLYGSNSESSRERSSRVSTATDSIFVPARYESPYPPQPQQNRLPYVPYYSQQLQQGYAPSPPVSTNFLPYQANRYPPSGSYTSSTATLPQEYRSMESPYFYPNALSTHPPYSQFSVQDYSYPPRELDLRTDDPRGHGRELESGQYYNSFRSQEPFYPRQPQHYQQSQPQYYSNQVQSTSQEGSFSNNYRSQFGPPPSNPIYQNEITFQQPSLEPPRSTQASVLLDSFAIEAETSSSLPVAPVNLNSIMSSRRAGKSVLPQPPVHSKFVMWCGNVPGDATESEMKEFFDSRPTPSEIQADLEPIFGLDFETNGVESIHLIARSNCAFINYVSQIHLQHAIAVTTGVSLRPSDPRIKELVCRVRRGEDEKKSGVGAQRLGGLHVSYVQSKAIVAAQNKRNKESSSDSSVSPPRGSEENASNESQSWSNSTTSSFLTKHFAKRFFVLKSHLQAELDTSVETGLWSTQSHNEPILDQAYRTSKDTYLIFGANKTGEWYGYARMAGPIRLCYSEATFPSSLSEAATPLRYPSTIPEGGELETFPPRPNLLFSASQNRLVEAPPAIMTPAGKGYAGTKAIIADPGEVSASFSAPASLVDGLHLPDTSPVPPLSPSKKSSLDSTTLAREKKSTMEEKMDRMDLGGVKTNSFDIDTSPPNEKCAVGSPWNASIELREDSNAQKGEILEFTYGKAFRIEWIKVQRLPFSRTRHIRNGFNENREVKVSRDGTEIEPTAGELLLEAFSQQIDSDSSPTGARQELSSPTNSQSTLFNSYFSESAQELKKA